jgi:hypothetical protein
MTMQTGQHQGTQQPGHGNPKDPVRSANDPQRDEGAGHDKARQTQGGSIKDQGEADYGNPPGTGKNLGQSQLEQPFSPGKQARVSDQGGKG